MLGLYWGYIGIMVKKMEITIMEYGDYEAYIGGREPLLLGAPANLPLSTGGCRMHPCPDTMHRKPQAYDPSMMF